jgi:hypothetical protein
MATSAITLGEVLTKAAAKVNIGGIYYHYLSPNVLYKVLHVALQEKDMAPCVVYKSLVDPKLIWTRTITSWLLPVMDNSKVRDRFTPIENELPFLNIGDFAPVDEAFICSLRKAHAKAMDIINERIVVTIDTPEPATVMLIVAATSISKFDGMDIDNLDDLVHKYYLQLVPGPKGLYDVNMSKVSKFTGNSYTISANDIPANQIPLRFLVLLILEAD